jgi:hypothetical protein
MKRPRAADLGAARPTGQDLVEMSGALAAVLVQEPDLRIRMQAAAEAITALDTIGAVAQATAVYAAAAPTAGAHDWRQTDRLSSANAPMEDWLKALCALFIAQERAGVDPAARARLLEEAWTIVGRCEAGDAENRNQQNTIRWILLRTLARCGRLDEAVAQVPAGNPEDNDIRAYDLAQLPALAWQHGHHAQADAVTARLLAADADIRFDLANTRLGAGDVAGAELLAAKGLPNHLVPVFNEHLLRYHAERGDFIRAFALRTRCRHGERSCAESLIGLAIDQGRGDIIRTIIAQELALGGPDAPVHHDYHWLRYRAQAGDEQPLLRYLADHLDDDPCGCAHQIATHARFLRIHRRRPATLRHLGALATTLALSRAAKRNFVYYEYGQCIVAAMAAGNPIGVQKTITRARRKSGWWSNLQVCYEWLCEPGSEHLALAFFNRHGRLLTRPTTSQRCLSHLCRRLAAKGQWRRARVIAATHRWKQGRGPILAAIMAGMAEAAHPGAL